MLTLGIDLGGTFARAAIIDEKRDMLAVAKTALSAKSPEAVADAVGQVAREALKLANHPPIGRCGVGVAAQLENNKGVVAVAPNLGWRNVNFGALLQDRLEMPVHLYNDLSAAAWGEFVAGAGAGAHDVFTVFVGSGVGSAIIANGRLVQGATHVAGEFGHIKVIPDGRLCGCGERGCLEAYVGGLHLAAQMKEAVLSEPTALAALSEGKLDSLSPVMLEEAIRLKDPAAQVIFDRASSLLALAVANQVTVLNPQRLVLGGGVLTHAPSFLRPIREGVDRFTLRVARRAVEVVTSVLGDDAGLMGAALLAAQEG